MIAFLAKNFCDEIETFNEIRNFGLSTLNFSWRAQ